MAEQRGQSTIRWGLIFDSPNKNFNYNQKTPMTGTKINKPNTERVWQYDYLMNVLILKIKLSFVLNEYFGGDKP